jgi:hypothetical protein
MRIGYTQFILTVIAALLAWNLLVQRPPVARAQSGAKYRVVVISMPDPTSSEREVRQNTINNVAEQLNKNADGGDLMMLVPIQNSGAAYAVFKGR